MATARFGRKVTTLEELKELNELARGHHDGTPYEVTREVELTNEEFTEFGNWLLKEQPWIAGEDGGTNNKGELRCIRVINKESGERVLVDSEGYNYPRYTAIEE
jgi:hypothetical protein